MNDQDKMHVVALGYKYSSELKLTGTEIAMAAKALGLPRTHEPAELKKSRIYAGQWIYQNYTTSGILSYFARTIYPLLLDLCPDELEAV